MLQTKVAVKMKTHILCSITPTPPPPTPKIVQFFEIKW